MKVIIESILDSDLYKFSMQWFVIQHYPEAETTYTFNNRSKFMTFTKEAVDEIKRQVVCMSSLRLTNEEYDWMKEKLYFLPIAYRQYLAAYHFNPKQVNITLLDNGELDIKIKGKWRDTILWEVPLMAIISEVYFNMIDTDWSMIGQEDEVNIVGLALEYCVCDTALDAVKSFKTNLLIGATGWLSEEGKLNTIKKLTDNKVEIID